MLTNKIFKKLFHTRDKNCVSMYVPAHQTKRGMESKSFFKRILSDVTEELIERGMDKKAAYRFLFNAYELVNEQLYWNNLNYDLGIFVSESLFKVLRIPYQVSPYFLVADRFYLRPLIPAVNGQSRFYVLALSEESANLYQGDTFTLKPVGADEMLPGSMEEALAGSGQGSNVQEQSGQSAFETPIYQGGDREPGSEHQLKQLKQYFHQVDQGINTIIEEEQAPLVIAAPDYMVPVYKETSNYLDITPVHISGEAKEDQLDALHQKAVEIIDNYFKDKQQAQADNFGSYRKKGVTSTSILDILPKASDGQVETLFLARDKHSWGRYDDKENTVEVFKEKEPNSIDLLSLAAAYTHLNGGKVYFAPAEEMPETPANINAIFRS